MRSFWTVAALAAGCVDSLSAPDAGAVGTRSDVMGLDGVAVTDTLLPDGAVAPDISYVDLGPFEWNPRTRKGISTTTSESS